MSLLHVVKTKREPPEFIPPHKDPLDMGSQDMDAAILILALPGFEIAN
jgi:hypothetical protein